MNRPLLLAAALTGAAMVGWLARCELDRRRLAESPRLDDSLRATLGGSAWLPRAANTIRAHMAPGDTAETVTVAVRDADGHPADYVMKPDYVIPVVAVAIPARRRAAR